MLNVLCCKLFWLPTVHTRPCSLAWCTMTVSLLAITVFRTEMTSMGNTKDMKVLTCGEREAAALVPDTGLAYPPDLEAIMPVCSELRLGGTSRGRKAVPM